MLAQDFQTAISLVSVGVGISLVPRSVSLSPRHGVVYRAYEGFNPGTPVSLALRQDNQGVHTQNFVTVAKSFARKIQKASR